MIPPSARQFPILPFAVPISPPLFRQLSENSRLLFIRIRNLVEYTSPPTAPQNNNGNVYRQDHFVPLNDSTSDWARTEDYYGYDALNRVTFISELSDTYIGGVFQQTASASQTDSYDRKSSSLTR